MTHPTQAEPRSTAWDRAQGTRYTGYTLVTASKLLNILFYFICFTLVFALYLNYIHSLLYV